MMMDNRDTIFDPIREKEVPLTPEERVRQMMVHFLIQELNYPKSRIANEYTISVGKLTRRCDTIVFDSQFNPLLVFEYKAPYVPLTQQVVEQVFQYNSALRVPYICISNGKYTIIYRIGYDGLPTELLPGIPSYETLLRSEDSPGR